MDNDLIRLGGDIADAVDFLRRALQLAVDLIGGDPEQDLPGWPAMEALTVQLDKLIKEVASLPGPEIEEAIRDAHAHLDYLSDLADGQSY